MAKKKSNTALSSKLVSSGTGKNTTTTTPATDGMTKRVQAKVATTGKSSVGGVTGSQGTTETTPEQNSEIEALQQQLAALQDQIANQTTSSADYMSVYNAYANNLNNILKQQQETANNQAKSDARAAYVSNEQSKAAVPQRLSTAGLTGGMAEKVQNNLNTSYKTALAKVLSDNAAQNAELERNNANLINEAYKEAMQNQQNYENQQSLAAQQYANQLALQQAQNEYDEKIANQNAADNALSSTYGRYAYSDNAKTGKMETSAVGGYANEYNTAKANGASQAALDAYEQYMLQVASERWNEKYGNKKNTTMTKEKYLQQFVGDRIGKIY